MEIAHVILHISPHLRVSCNLLVKLSEHLLLSSPNLIVSGDINKVLWGFFGCSSGFLIAVRVIC